MEILVWLGFWDNEWGKPTAQLQMNRLSLKNNRLMFIETSWKSPIILEESMRIYLKLIKKTRKNITTCDWLDLKTLDSWPIMPENPPDTGLKNHTKTWVPHPTWLLQLLSLRQALCQLCWPTRDFVDLCISGLSENSFRICANLFRVFISRSETLSLKLARTRCKDILHKKGRE
jgi:hypothetical protein